MFNMGPLELTIIGGLAVLLFGKKLPDVAKKVGKSYAQFRKGLSDMQAQLQIDDDLPTSSNSYYADDEYDDYDTPAAPKFEPPTSEPTTEAEEV